MQKSCQLVNQYFFVLFQIVKKHRGNSELAAVKYSDGIRPPEKRRANEKGPRNRGPFRVDTWIAVSGDDFLELLLEGLVVPSERTLGAGIGDLAVGIDEEQPHRQPDVFPVDVVVD